MHMDYTAEELEDLAELRALRLRLRACAIAKVAECEALPAAKNTLEMNRQIRAIDGADRLLVALYTPRRPLARLPVAKAVRTPSPFDEIDEVAKALMSVTKVVKNAKHLRPLKPRPETDPNAPFDSVAAMHELREILQGALPETRHVLPAEDAADVPEAALAAEPAPAPTPPPPAPARAAHAIAFVEDMTRTCAAAPASGPTARLTTPSRPTGAGTP